MGVQTCVFVQLRYEALWYMSFIRTRPFSSSAISSCIKDCDLAAVSMCCLHRCWQHGIFRDQAYCKRSPAVRQSHVCAEDPKPFLFFLFCLLLVLELSRACDLYMDAECR